MDESVATSYKFSGTLRKANFFLKLLNQNCSFHVSHQFLGNIIAKGLISDIWSPYYQSFKYSVSQFVRVHRFLSVHHGTLAHASLTSKFHCRELHHILINILPNTRQALNALAEKTYRLFSLNLIHLICRQIRIYYRISLFRHCVGVVQIIRYFEKGFESLSSTSSVSRLDNRQ